MFQKQRTKTISEIERISRHLNESGLTEEEKRAVSLAMREKQFNLRSRVKSVNCKAQLSRNYREYEDKTKLSIPQIVEYELKQSRQSVQSVKHKQKFVTVFSIVKPKYDPSIVYGCQNNRTILSIKDILRKL